MASSRTAPAALSLLLALPLAGCTDAEPVSAPSGSPPAATAPSGLPQLVAAVEPSVITVLVGEGGLGSGVVFRDGGLVLTNEHVVGDARTVRLALADGSRVDARIVGTDAVTDLAVLRAERADLPPVPFRVELPLPGETVLAMGSPWASATA